MAHADFDPAEWLTLQGKMEVNRLKEFSLHPILVGTLDCQIQRTPQGVVNLLSIDVPVDVESIKEVVVSDPKQHPFRPDVLYSTCLLMNKKDANRPFLCIYTRPGKLVPGASLEAEMREWVLTANGTSKRHSIAKNRFPANRRKFINTER
ncbi:hypothetical protein HDV03_002814 [Kappamyces sp. JEL0829]|nr:hypothetical protein HDV03_002814 [Kappamyces sp. JEL0829]